jgi:hypothetical protein
MGCFMPASGLITGGFSLRKVHPLNPPVINPDAGIKQPIVFHQQLWPTQPEEAADSAVE